MPESSAEIIDSLRRFVHAEFAAQRQHFDARQEQPLAHRLDSGHCLGPLRFEIAESENRWIFSHGGNDSRLREGDQIRLSDGGTGEIETGRARCWEGSVYREEDERLWLVFERPPDSLLFQARRELWYADESFLDLREFFFGRSRPPGADGDRAGADPATAG